MVSNDHYPEEAPVHRDGFWIDGTPVTNRQFNCHLYLRNSVRETLVALRNAR